MNDQEKAFEAEIKASLDRIDEWVEIERPSLHQLQFMVSAQKKESRKKMIIELFFFWMASLIIMFAGIISFVYGVLVFICFQALVTLCLGIPFLFKRKRGVDF